MTPIMILNSPAGATKAASFLPTCIDGIEGMAPRTMCSPAFMSRNPIATQDILPMRYDLEVVGIDTMSDATKMVNGHTWRDRANQDLVCSTVGIRTTAPPPKDAISGTRDATCPQPTIARRVNFRPESLGVFCGKLKRHSKSPNQIWGATPSAVLAARGQLLWIIPQICGIRG